MTFKNSIIFFLILFLSTISVKNKELFSARRVKITLPFSLKWNMTPAKVKKTIKIKKLKWKGAWIKYDKKNIRYWMYFKPNKQKLVQITLVFKKMSEFTKFMNNFSYKYKEIKVKANLYKDVKTTVGINATINPTVVFMRN